MKIITKYKIIINDLLTSFSVPAASEKGNQVFYYKENAQLNDVLKTKTDLIQMIAYRKIELINSTKIVKDSSNVLNIKNNTSLNGKMKFTVPILFIALFLFVGLLKSFYKAQMRKMNTVSAG